MGTIRSISIELADSVAWAKMQDADRKAIWSLVAVSTVIALELLWIILTWVSNGHSIETQRSGNWDWVRSAAFWTAAFTALLTLSTVLLWFSTRESVRISEKALKDLERPYLFVYDLSGFKKDREGWNVVTYSAGNYGKTAAIVERVQVALWHGEPEHMTVSADETLSPADHPLLMTRVLSPDYAKDAITFLVPGDIDIKGTNPASLYPGPGSERPLFFRIIVEYRGPFTTGHVGSFCWEYDFGLGIFNLILDPHVTYTR